MTSVVSLRLEQEGRAQALGLATLSELPATGLAWDVAAMPAARPPPRTCRRCRADARRRAGLHGATTTCAGRCPGGEARRAGDRRLAAHGGAARARRAARRGHDGRLGARRLRRRRAVPRRADARPHDPHPPPAARRPGMGPSSTSSRASRTRLAVGGVWEEDGELWTPGRASCSRSRASSRSRGSCRVTRHGLPRPGLERRRPAREPAGRRRRAARRTASTCSPPPPSTRPSRWARCSTSARSSTPACASARRSAPEALLDACKAVERELGRAPGGVRHGPRPIDVDVLLLGDEVHRSERLRCPHEQVTLAPLRARPAAGARRRS